MNKIISLPALFVLPLALVVLGAPTHAADAAPTASFFVTLTQAAGVTLDNSPSAVTQAAPDNGWNYSAAAPVPGTTWNKVANPTRTPQGGGPYTEENPFVLDTLNNFPLYDANGNLTSVRLKGVVIGTIDPSRQDPRTYGVTGATAKELLTDTWGMYTADSAAYMKFAFSGLTPNTHYCLYLYSNVRDGDQGGKWILHPDNFPGIKPSDFYYPTLPDRLTSFLDLSGHLGTVTIFGTDTDGDTLPVPGAVFNTPSNNGDNTPWGALHAVSTATGEITFRTASAANGRRWYTGFQLVPYPAPTITEQPFAESVAVLNVSTEISAVARDMINLRFADEADQNPLAYQWQFSSDNGATWADLADEDPLLPETTPAGAYDAFLDRDPPLPANPEDPAPPVARYVSTLVIHAPQFSDAGLYRLKVTNVAGGSAFSDPCALTVIDHADPFSITQQPLPDAATVGDAAALSVAVAGTPPFTYIWQKQACDPATATPAGGTATGDFEDVLTVRKTRDTTSTLDFPFLRRADTGYYRVKVMDVMQKEADALTSDTVYLYVEYAPPIITPPGRQTVAPGGAIRLYSDIYTEIPLLWYKWQVSHDNGVTWTDITDGGAYSGATTDTLTIAAAAAAEAGLYRVVSANNLGTTEGGAITLAVAAPMIAHPVAVAADRAGRVYAADDTANLLHQFTLATGTAVRFAGQPGVAGSADGYYGQAAFNGPSGAAIGPANVVYLADTGNHTLRALRATGEVTTIAGSPAATGNADGTGAAASFTAPAGITHDSAGSLYVADRMAHVIRRVTPTTFDVTTLAGVANDPGSAGGITTDTQGNTLARFNSPGGIAASPVVFAATGTAIPLTASSTTTVLYVADTGNNAIRKISLTWYLDRDPVTSGTTRTRIRQNDVSTLAGLTGVAGHADGDGSAAQFNAPASLAVDDAGAIYVADTGNNVIRKISLSGPNGSIVTVSTLAGLNGIAGHQDGPGAETSLDGLPHNLFNQPRDVSVDPAGNVYVADTGNAAVRKITPDGVVSTLVPDQGPAPIPPETPGPGGGSGEQPDIPPAGSGDGSGEFGGGAPSPLFLAALALLGLLKKFRARLLRAAGSLPRARSLSRGPAPVGPDLASGGSGGMGDSPMLTALRAANVWKPGDAAHRHTGESPVPRNPSASLRPRVSPSLPRLRMVGPPSGRVCRRPNPKQNSCAMTKASATPCHTAPTLAFMKPAPVLLFLVLAAAFAGLALPPAARAVEEPVFVTLNRANYSTDYPKALTIAAPGNGWEYSAAAPVAGTIWNEVCKSTQTTANEVYTEADPFILNSLNNISLRGAVSGTIGPVRLTGVFVGTNTRAEPGDVSAGGAQNVTGLLGACWRLYGANTSIRFTFSNLTPNAHYYLYCYANTNGKNQGGRYILSPQCLPPGVFENQMDDPAETTATNFIDLKGTDTDAYISLFNGDGALIPAAPINTTAANDSNTIWGAMHVRATAAGDVIFRAKGSGFFSGFQLIPYPKAIITTDLPVATTASLGGGVTLTIAAAGFDADDVLTYQWRKDSVAISTTDNPSAATAALTLTGLASADEAAYDCVVTNYGGDTATGATALTVTAGAVAPSIGAQPSAQTAATGGAAAFSVSANGTAPLAYAWQFSTSGTDTGFSDLNTTANPSAATATLALAGVTTADAGWYRVKITNTAGDITSTAVTLTVAPVITAPPAGAVVTPGSAASLTVTADAGPALAPFAPAYVWKRNGVTVADGSGISGAATATLSFASFSAANSGNYTVTAANAAGSVTSDPVYLGTPAAMTAALWPANGATAVNPDTPLKLTFTGGTPEPGSIGKILIRDAADDTVAETIDLSALETRNYAGADHFGYAAATVQNTAITCRPFAVYGNEVWITRPGGLALGYGKTYYVTIEPGVIFDQDGATYPGIAAADKTAWRFTTRAAAPDLSDRAITVAADGTGDTTTVQAALNQIPQNNTDATPYTVTLAPGVYHESLVLGQNRKFVTIKGSGSARTDTVISHGWCEAGGGAVSAVLIIYTDDVRVENLTIENTAGETAGQQRAATLGNKRVVFDSVLLKGWQDTLAIWNNCVAYFRDCEIWGSVDFVYGGGTALFDHCDLVSIRATGGHVAAPSTNYQSLYGLVFRDCRLIAGSTAAGHPQDVPAASCGFMRPWYENGHTAFINCVTDAHIFPKGWDSWGDSENTCRAIEIGTTLAGGGAAPTPAERQAAGAYWLNTYDPDYTANGTTDSTMKSDPLLKGADGIANRQPVEAGKLTADYYSIEAIFGNNPYYAGAIGAWRPSVAPRILTQPVAQSATPGATVTLSVTAFGLPDGTWQWHKGATPVADGGNISGATTATLTLANAQPGDSGDYHAVVTNSLGSAASDTVAVTISASLAAPAITTQPSSQTVDAGDPVTFTVAATGDPAPAFQWFKNGAPLADGGNISGATTATLSIAAAAGADAGDYYVTATNTQGSVTSDTVTLTVNGGGAPAITAQPVSQITAAGSPVTLSVSATGATGYQWYKDGVAIPGATGATLTISSPTSADAGTYYCVINGAGGETTTATVTLTVEGATPSQAVFVKLSTDTAPAAGVVTTATTFEIAVQGSGWDYSAAAPFPGVTWNKILKPAASSADEVNAQNASVGDFLPFSTASATALTAPDGSPTPVTLTMHLGVGNIRNRVEPSNGSGANTTLGPAALMAQAWRIYDGAQTLRFTLDGVPAGTHYLVYFYGATLGRGARFTLADANIADPAASWLLTNGTSGNGEVFASADGIIAPKPAATPGDSVNNTEKPWGILHAIADADSKLTFTASKGNDTYINGFQLIPYPKAVITTQPAATAYVAEGDTTTLSVIAVGLGDETLTYQWRKDGVPINTADNPTADTASLAITGAQPADAGSYDCVVTNLGGSVISDACAFTLTAGTGAPSIVLQPAAQTGVAGDTVSLGVAAGGQPPLTYTWQKSVTGPAAGFADLPGAPSASTLALTGLAAADAGWYRVKITNTLGETTSDAATLIVAPVITAQPASAVTSAGATATLTVTADSGIAAAPFAPSYAWFKDGSGTPLADGGNISGATTATITLTAFSAADAGSYTVVVANTAGSVTSDAATLQLPVAPAITTQPAASQAVLAGWPATFTAAASGVPAPEWQWYKDGFAIAGATAATYTIATAAESDSGSYHAVATNMAGSATTSATVLTVRDLTGPAVTGDGFAGGVTGGAGGPAYEVTTAADLNARLQLAGPAIIIVSGTIDVRPLSSSKRVDVTSNKTLQGANAAATIIGRVNINNVQNVIVRGLNITNPGTIPSTTEFPRYEDGGDGVTIQNATGVLVTHCTFYDCADGMCDLTYTVRDATVSWCKFYYPTQANHRFTMILGNEATPADTPVTATLHHNWWGERCDQRMPAAGAAQAHMYGNYFSCAGNSYASNARGTTQILIEHSYYNGVKDPVGKSDATAAFRTINNTYNNTTGTKDPGTDTVSVPPYSYTLPDTADVPALIQNYAGNTAGAWSDHPVPAAPLALVGASGPLFVGGTVTLVPAAPVAGAATYQWRRNNFAVEGATGDTLVLAGVQTAQLGDYTLAVTTAAGNTVVSAPVAIAFTEPPSFPSNTGATVATPAVTGKAITLHPVTEGTVISYQWQRWVPADAPSGARALAAPAAGEWVNVGDNDTYSGATTGALTIQNVTGDVTGQYRLVVTNPTGEAISDTYAVTVTPVVFAWPSGVAVDAFGDVYVSDASASIIRRVTATGSAALYAGIPGAAGSADGAFGQSTFNSPGALAIDAAGNLYVADTGNATVRRVGRDLAVLTLAGDPAARGNRDGIGNAALFASPNGISFDRATGVTYVADTSNHTLRVLTPRALNNGVFVGNTVATFAGVPGQPGDADTAWEEVTSGTTTTFVVSGTARFNHPGAVAVSGSFLYIADTGNNTIRRLTLPARADREPPPYEVITLAGTPGVTGFDDGAGVDALFASPKAIVADTAGANLYVADTGNHTIRRVTAAGVVTTLAGLPGVSGQGDGDGSVALFNQPAALALDVSGSHLYVADIGNTAVRRITLGGATVTVSTLSVIAADDSTLPPSGTLPPFTPTSKGSGGGAPSPWLLAVLAALAFLRFVRNKR